MQATGLYGERVQRSLYTQALSQRCRSSLSHRHVQYPMPSLIARSFSSDPGNKANSKAQSESASGDEEETTKEIVMTPGEQVVAAGRLTMWAGIGVFALCCAYYIGVELFPTYVYRGE